MTLNGHLALKSGLSSASNGLAFFFPEKCRKFGNLQNYHRLSAAKNVTTHWTGGISVIGLFTGAPQKGSVKPVNCIHTRSSRTMLLTDIENK